MYVYMYGMKKVVIEKIKICITHPTHRYASLIKKQKHSKTLKKGIHKNPIVIVIIAIIIVKNPS